MREYGGAMIVTTLDTQQLILMQSGAGALGLFMPPSFVLQLQIWMQLAVLMRLSDLVLSS